MLKNKGHKNFEVISEQLKEIVRRGNNVELHLHPQWIDAIETDDGGWKFVSYEHYRLHAFSESEITKMISGGKMLLEEIVNEAIPGYKVTSFRAGGWSITPFEKLSNGFESAGIELDFSVLPEAYMLDSDANYYDFRGVPDKTMWRFEENPLVENRNGRFIEVPCTRYTQTGFFSLLNKILNYNSSFMGDGRGVQYTGRSKKMLKMIYQRQNYYFTIDYTAPYIFSSKINSAVSKTDLISVYSHPKCFSKNSEINLTFLLKKYKTLSVSEIKEKVNSVYNECKSSDPIQ
jgi:hypothetical protein